MDADTYRTRWCDSDDHDECQGWATSLTGERLTCTCSCHQANASLHRAILCAHADSDGEGAHWLAPGERCTQPHDEDDQ